jgi:hypothetical protein
MITTRARAPRRMFVANGMSFVRRGALRPIATRTVSLAGSFRRKREGWFTRRS